MPIVIKKAVKFGAKLRMALYGTSGSGKTMTSLLIAKELAGEKRIIVIDTERGSASKYADVVDFDVIELDSFHPSAYIEAIKAAVQAKEYSVLIIDSVSHEWDGSKGALELAGQNFTNWAKVTPLHNAFIDAMLSADIHVIATMRAKEEHVMEKVEGKNKPEVRSIGIEPIQRKGMQYEFDVVGSLDYDNTLTIVKTRCSALLGGVFHRAGSQIVDILKPWLDGAPAPERSQSHHNGQHTPLSSAVIDKAQSDWAGAYCIPDAQIEARWPRYVAHVLKKVVADPDITEQQLSLINEDIEQQRLKRPTQNGKEVAQAS